MSQMRSFAAVLLRRLAFRPVPSDHTDINRSGALTIYDHLSEDTRFRTERALLRCLHDEAVDGVRKKVADTITDLAIGSMERGRPWPELQTATFEGTQSSTIGHREVAFRILANVPHLVLDTDTSIVLRVMQGGLKDAQSVEVCERSLLRSRTRLTYRSIGSTCSVKGFSIVPQRCGSNTAGSGSRPHASDARGL